MNDERAQRDDLEVTQTALKRVRAQLAAPLDRAGISREVGLRLEILEPEHEALKAKVEGLGGLRGRVEEVRLWSLATKARQPPNSVRASLGLLAFITLASTYVWCGLEVGTWLGRTGYSWAGAAIGAVSCAVLLLDVRGLTRWFQARNQGSGPAP